MDIPKWLTTSYIEHVLRVYYKDPELTLTECEIRMALGKGENYGGILLKALTVYTSKGGAKKKSYIIKMSYEMDEFAKEKMAPYDIFNREMSIYENVLPKLNKLKNEAHIDDELFARAIHVDYERSALIFEDLSCLGFVMADRTKGLDIDHAKLILRKLAVMGATSAVLNERDRGCLEKYDRGFFNRYTDVYSTYFLGCLDACTQLVGQWPEYNYYSQKLRNLRKNYMEIGKRCFEPTPHHVNVLAHGDVWTNNVMFKYNSDSRQPIDVRLIDFQYSFWGSPTLDLHHFFNTSLKEDLRLNRQGELFQYYHKMFTNILKILRYHTNCIPSLHQFQLQADEKRFFGFHSSCIIQPVMINEKTEDADFNALMAEDERAIKFRNTIYQNKKVHRNLKNLLPFFDRKGLLDSNQCD